MIVRNLQSGETDVVMDKPSIGTGTVIRERRGWVLLRGAARVDAAVRRLVARMNFMFMVDDWLVHCFRLCVLIFGRADVFSY